MTNSDDVERWYHGTCPRCGQHKFIGHGPLCVDCFADPTSTEADD